MRLRAFSFVTLVLHALVFSLILRRGVAIGVTTPQQEAKQEPPDAISAAPLSQEEGEENGIDPPLESERQDIRVEVIHMTDLEEISNLLRDPSASAKSQSPALQEYLSFESHVTFVLALIYSEKCVACRARMEQFVHQVPQLWQAQQKQRQAAAAPTTNNTDILQSLPPPVLLLLSIDSQDTEKALTKQLESFGVVQIPALLWMLRDTAGNTFVLDFMATERPDSLTAQEILRAFQHLQTRLLVLSSNVSFEDPSGVLFLQPRSFSNTRNDAKTSGSSSSSSGKNETVASSELERWFMENGADIFRPVIQTFPGPLLESERNYATWLWYEQGDTANDGFILLGQCRKPGDEANVDILNAFDRLRATWLDRRDVVMVAVSDCPHANEDVGKVYLWRIFPNTLAEEDSLNLSWDAAERVVAIDSSLDNTAESFKNALVEAITPSLVWLDRETTAPIAFPLGRNVHALLAIDVHREIPGGPSLSPFDQKQAMVLRQFRQLCRTHQRNPLTEDLVCLVVPSTDIRTLTIFGIDIWTPMDVAAWQSKEDTSYSEILPVFFITDQRFGGTRRYYLEHEIVKNIGVFWMDFWDGKLVPYPKSSSSSSTNKAGVVSITSVEFQQTLLENSSIQSAETDNPRSKHSLVLFTSSMCGHCRRLLALWDQFGRMVQNVGWSYFLTLYQMDVSTDEVLLSDSWNVTIRWVPDLLYVSPGDNPRVIRYEEKDEYGDHVVGGVKSYMDLVEWFLHVATLDDTQILEILSGVRKLLAEEESTD